MQAPAFTPREIEVLRGVHAGLSDKEIGFSLGLAQGTIKQYLIHVRYRMQAAGLGSMSRTQMALWVERGGLQRYECERMAGKKMAYSVVIPSKTAANVYRCIKSIKEAGEHCRIFVIDDGVDWESIRDEHGVFLPCGYEVGIIPGLKPFCFARNVNLGIQAAGDDDVIIMNDDAGLQTPNGLQRLAELAYSGTRFPAMPHNPIGMVGPVTEHVGNVRQLQRAAKQRLRWEPRMLCFVCCYIPRHVLRAVGPLDERYTHYGMDDDDYSLRIRNAGFTIGITDEVFVDHGHVASSFRGEGGAGGDFTHNLQLFIGKWGHDNHGLDRDQSSFRALFPRKL